MNFCLDCEFTFFIIYTPYYTFIQQKIMQLNPRIINFLYNIGCKYTDINLLTG